LENIELESRIPEKKYLKLEDLDLYNLCLAWEDKIWEIVIKWDYFTKDTVGKQFVRSADSMSANIAEGYGRYYYKENRQFCFYSRGSMLESKGWLEKAKRRNLVDEKDYLELMSDLEIIHKKLNSYIKSIGIKALNEKQT
jgi:four helix bundle protein